MWNSFSRPSMSMIMDSGGRIVVLQVQKVDETNPSNLQYLKLITKLERRRL